MYGSNVTLPPPTSFTHELLPLRLTSESTRPQPYGGCHFQHPLGQHQRCLCQTYQHNRTQPGNLCDCGHSACYHAPGRDGRLSPDRVVSALLEKVKKLEEVIIKERETRNNMVTQERQAREREVRVLREALAPFYHTESDMRRKLVELEDRVESTYDEHSRLRQKVVAIDDASITLERRLDDFELARCRKRKASLGHEGTGVMSPNSNYTCSSSSVSDATSVSTQRSPQPPSPMNPPLPASIYTAPLKSQDVLHLVNAGPTNPTHHPYQDQHKSQLPSPCDEPRSSGFLSIDLAERLRKHKINPTTVKDHHSAVKSNGLSVNGSYKSSSGLCSPPYKKVSSGAVPLSGLLSSGDTTSNQDSRLTKKRKEQHGAIMALDVLAHVTAQSSLAH